MSFTIRTLSRCITVGLVHDVYKLVQKKFEKQKEIYLHPYTMNTWADFHIYNVSIWKFSIYKLLWKSYISCGLNVHGFLMGTPFPNTNSKPQWNTQFIWCFIAQKPHPNKNVKFRQSMKIAPLPSPLQIYIWFHCINDLIYTIRPKALVHVLTMYFNIYNSNRSSGVDISCK